MNLWNPGCPACAFVSIRKNLRRPGRRLRLLSTALELKMKRKRGLLILWTFHSCEWSVDVFFFSFSFYIFKQEDRVLRQKKKNRRVSEQAGINVIFFRCTRKYIFFTIWLVLHSSECVLHVLLGHSNREHENTLTKTAKLWILWRINLQGSSHKISGPLTAIQIFFYFFLSTY